MRIIKKSIFQHFSVKMILDVAFYLKLRSQINKNFRCTFKNNTDR